MKHVKLRDLEVVPHRARGDGHVRRLHRRRQRRRRVDPHHPPGARSRRHLHRHRRGLRAAHQRGARRPRPQGPPRDRSCSATKFGFMSNTGRGGLDSSPENIRLAVEGSLRRLGTDYIDLYYQHRVDPTPRSKRPSARWPSSSPRARSATSGCPKRARRPSAGRTLCIRSPRCSRSTRCGPVTPKTESSTFCRELGIGFVPYSPLGHGFLTGAIRSHGRPRRRRLAQDQPSVHRRELRAEPAHRRRGRSRRRELGATPAQVAIAWLLAQGDDIAPIPGTKRVARLEENVAADAIELTAEQLDRLNELPAPAGEHHNEAQMQMIDRS